MLVYIKLYYHYVFSMVESNFIESLIQNFSSNSLYVKFYLLLLLFFFIIVLLSFVNNILQFIFIKYSFKKKLVNKAFYKNQLETISLFDDDIDGFKENVYMFLNAFIFIFFYGILCIIILRQLPLILLSKYGIPSQFYFWN